MKILLVGGGSGGHVTPLKAIAEELDTDVHQVSIISDRGFFKQAEFLFKDNKNVKLYKIFAGKYRRYQSKSFVWHIIHLPTLLKNIRDIFYLAIGLLQATVLMVRLKPDVVFCKGGFVCIPVGVSARLFKKKIIIHDSDTRPGLTNRILSKWAYKIATGMPADFYPYPKDKMVHVGMPVASSFKSVSEAVKESFKTKLGFKHSQPVLLVTGGGNGSEQINNLVNEIAPDLLDLGWGIEHITGKGKSKSTVENKGELGGKQKSWHVSEFTDMLPRLLAADIVVARTSASTLQECANSKKVVVGLPSPHLSDQIMNAEYFESKNSLVYIKEDDLSAKKLKDTLQDLQKNKASSEALGENLYKNFAMPNAAKQIAKIISQ